MDRITIKDPDNHVIVVVSTSLGDFFVPISTDAARSLIDALNMVVTKVENRNEAAEAGVIDMADGASHNGTVTGPITALHDKLREVAGTLKRLDPSLDLDQPLASFLEERT